MKTSKPYRPTCKIRVLTAGSLFDGHDAAINLIRRLLQQSGAEVIHLGHNRSASEIVQAAIQEDVQAVAITSYQGGHMEFFGFVHDLLIDQDAGHIKIFVGGGGTILPAEIEAIHNQGITRIYSPDDGREMGLQGMIHDLLAQSDFENGIDLSTQMSYPTTDMSRQIGQIISVIENHPDQYKTWSQRFTPEAKEPVTPVIGITGTGGAGKSSLIDEWVLRYLKTFADKTLGIICIDPSKRKTGGALLGDRIRMNAIHSSRVYMRSMATRGAHQALSDQLGDAITLLKHSGFDLIIVETSGIGQADSQIADFVDLSLYVMTPEYGARSQLEKINMLDYADIVAVNKFDKLGAQDALTQVKKQVQQNQARWDEDPNDMPVYGTIAAQYKDPGVDRFFAACLDRIFPSQPTSSTSDPGVTHRSRPSIIPPHRTYYLTEICQIIKKYGQDTKAQSVIAGTLGSLKRSLHHLQTVDAASSTIKEIASAIHDLDQQLTPENQQILSEWAELKARYQADRFTYAVRNRRIQIENFSRTLSGTSIPKIALPTFYDDGQILQWCKQENVPGRFPFTAGVYPFKRKEEDPTRMFAGEGGPERTNRRFHYLSKDMKASRLSTAFDSVTLYGEDPDPRPDTYGKVGNSGVSIASLNDMKKLFSGFDLCDTSTSVSMTINGPAAAVCAFFFNAAIDQQCECYISAHGLEDSVEKAFAARYDAFGIDRPSYVGALPESNDGLGLMLLGLTGDQVLNSDTYQLIKDRTLQRLRGTVQADILKEDQAQNTCIFSTEFSLRLMGDMQAYFVGHKINNFYSVSISGYHIAEAGANPITQLAFTLANGFTYVEYYLSRGMHIDEFAPNLSFFFSNGIDAEYAVIGRVARRIWAKAIKYKYGGNERSQKLKYHVQTSGRSLHAQEISFNDIRTTLQALYAIYDHCNSLHTNAYDEAITTPTEESVRRAMAIQLIINHELGLAINENPLQGSFIIETLTDLVESAVLEEFDRISQRGGVLGAMESMYQRTKIQEESLTYEHKKHSGELPIIGVNTFLSAVGSPTSIPHEVIRATAEEKARQISNTQAVKKLDENKSSEALKLLEVAVRRNENAFVEIMEATKVCTLGQITHALFELGGRYRRNM